MHKIVFRLLLLALCWWGSLLVTWADPVQINVKDLPVDIAQQWRCRDGDDLSWAQADFDDANWPATDLASVWSRQGFVQHNNFTWYRRTVLLPWKDRETIEQYRLAVTITNLEYSSYEVYANGLLIGKYGSLPPQQQTLVARPMTFPLPNAAIGHDGQIVFAVRLWRDPAYTRVMAKLFYLSPGFYFRVGNINTLENLVELQRKRLVIDDIPKIICACLMFLVGLYHLQLFRRRRQLKEYFWFGIHGLASGTNLIFFTTWLDTWLPPVMIYASGMVAIYAGNFCWIQFIWLIFGWKFNKLVRFFQALQLVMLMLLIIAPKFIITDLGRFSFIPLSFLFIVSLGLIPREAWRGNPEARTISAGLLFLASARAYQMLGFWAVVPRLNLSHWGFLALLSAIAVSLSNRFNRVYTELDTLNQELEDKVVARTAELAETVTKLQISEQKTEEKNQQILDSIRYAEHIQKAMFPGTEQLKLALQDYFILFKPKDIVSGDFYWIRKVDNKVIVALADCTGHGVPGAFMSMMGNTLLNQIIIEKKIFNPSQILQQLNDSIRFSLLSDEKESNVEDGMDIGICCIDLIDRTLLFAAAKQSLYYIISGQELIEIKGDRRSIGGKQKKTSASFTNHAIALNAPITIYLSTDGFADQNDIDGKKYGSNRLKSLLQANASLSLSEQYQALLQEMEIHRGEQAQRDDITIVSFRIC